jgi:hypothetical protein
VGAVAATDVEAVVRAEKTALVSDSESAVVVLRVDDEEAGRSDYEVVDVAARAWDATVVQGDDVRQAGNRLGEPRLTARSYCPSTRGLGFIDHGQQQTAEPPTEPLLDPLFALSRSSVVLPLGRAAGGADIERRDIPIRQGSALLYVRTIDGAPPVVRVFSLVLRGVEASQPLLEALNEINGRIMFGRVLWASDRVIVSAEVSAVGISTEQIAFLYASKSERLPTISTTN